MDLLISVAIILLLSAFSIFWWYITIPANLPPGPLGLPFIGSYFETHKGSTLCGKLRKWTEKYGPLYKLYVGDKLVIVLGNWDLIQEALVKQGDVYAGRPKIHTMFPDEITGQGLTTTEGELWKIQRRFALATLRDFGFGRPIIEPRIQHEAEYLLDAISAQNQRPIDPTALLSNAVTNVICFLVFGRRFEYEDEEIHGMLGVLRTRLSESDVSFPSFIVMSNKLITKIIRNLPQFRVFKETNSTMLAFLRGQVARTLKDFNPDQGDEPTNYVQAFYKAKYGEDNWTFTDDQLVASVANLFIAGTDTTSITLRWAIFLMAHYPEWQERIYEEIKAQSSCHSLLSYADRPNMPLTNAAMMEIRRMADLLPIGFFRRTSAPSKLCGYDIPTGTIVVPLLTAALSDPTVYPNPDKFDPTRFLQANGNEEKGPEFTHLITFSAGKRMCLGESLARMELFIFFTSLMSRFRFYFPPNEPIPPMESKTAIFHVPAKFKICAEGRNQLID